MKTIARKPTRVLGIFVFLLIATFVGQTAMSHSPLIDADLSDWCLFVTPRVENSAATLFCAGDAEVVWWDAPADGAVNDLATVATTQDATNLYWAAELHVDPDPVSLPFAEIAIDVGHPGGTSTWWDPLGNIKSPGHCSVDTSRLCTTDIDCHFCTNSTIYTGTPNERPRPCGSTNMIDSCDDFDDSDLCIREQTCVGGMTGDPAPGVGVFSSPTIEPDYLLVFDFSRWFVALCDATKLLRSDGAGGWVEIPRPVPDPLCPLPTWHFLPAVDPGASGGSGGPPGKIELTVPWEAFDCDGCPEFGPGTPFQWTLEVNRGTLTLDYLPDGAVEDVMSEAVAGSTTATTNSCPAPGEPSTECEIADGSTDSFVPLLASTPGGRVDNLLMSKGGLATSITLDWDASCSGADTDYSVYEGEIPIVGGNYTHVPADAGGLCTTGGATTATFDSADGDSYYLVVPNDGGTEGSYGVDSGNSERPASTAPCLAQSLADCP